MTRTEQRARELYAEELEAEGLYGVARGVRHEGLGGDKPAIRAAVAALRRALEETPPSGGEVWQ